MGCYFLFHRICWNKPFFCNAKQISGVMLDIPLKVGVEIWLYNFVLKRFLLEIFLQTKIISKYELYSLFELSRFYSSKFDYFCLYKPPDFYNRCPSLGLGYMMRTIYYPNSKATSDFWLINWDSLHASLDCHYESWSYKKKKHKKIKAYSKYVQKEPTDERCSLILGLKPFRS